MRVPQITKKHGSSRSSLTSLLRRLRSPSLWWTCLCPVPHLFTLPVSSSSRLRSRLRLRLWRELWLWPWLWPSLELWSSLELTWDWRDSTEAERWSSDCLLQSRQAEQVHISTNVEAIKRIVKSITAECGFFTLETPNSNPELSLIRSDIGH